MKAPLWIFAAIALTVAGCAAQNPTAHMPQITFQHEVPVNLAVDRIEVVNAYKAPLAPPNVEHKMETTPAQAVEIWAHDRLKAAGDPNGSVARLTIDTAKLTEEKLPLTEGIKGTFTTDQAFRYNLEIAATLEIVDGGGQVMGHAETRTMRSRTTPENATLNDLHQVWFKMLEASMRDFDKEMELNIRKFLPNWVR